MRMVLEKPAGFPWFTGHKNLLVIAGAIVIGNVSMTMTTRKGKPAPRDPKRY